jgi:hypothetical protein
MAKNRSDKSAGPSERHRGRWGGPRIWAVAMVTFRQAMRMRLWILAPVAILILVLADLWSPRFDPVFESLPAAIGTSLMAMTVLTVLVGVFFATYSMPAEVESKIVFSLVTKPISRTEIVVGKTLGMSVLLAALLCIVGIGAYIYISISAGGVQSLAAARLDEAGKRAAHPADLNALAAVARTGPLMTFRYREADMGPAMEVHYSPDQTPEDTGQRWILGESGMRLLWSLPDVEWRQWLAEGPGRLRVKLSVRIPPGLKKEETVRIAVHLTSTQDMATRELAPAGITGTPVREVYVDIAKSSEIEIPVASAQAPPVRGTLNLPAEGDLVLEILASKAGHLVGAGPDAVTLEGPGGRHRTVLGQPEARGAVEGRKIMAVGRSILPREQVVFNFADVPAAMLGSDDTAVEIGFSLDAWNPPLVQPAVQATFLNPASGQETVLQFTPEANHSTLLYVDTAFWHGGPLEVRLESLTDDNYLGFTNQGVRLRVAGGPFLVHFGKAILCVWLFGTVLAAAGVCFSMRLSWYVSLFATAVFFLVCSVQAFILMQPWATQTVRLLTQRADTWWPWTGWYPVIRHVLLPLPDLPSLLPPQSVNFGQVMPLADLAGIFGWAVLSATVLMAVGSLAFWKREVAA